MKNKIRLPFAIAVRIAPACAVAISISSCCMLTQPASDTRMKTLEATHISFIDNHTKEGAKTAWDQTAYSTETAAILGQYHSAEASESQFCPSRLALVKQAEALVTVDINLISKTHGVSNGYATRQKKQVSAFYDGSSAP